MLELDEYNQLLVTNPFADDENVIENNLTPNSSPQNDPLRSPSISPSCRTPNDINIPTTTAVGSEGGSPLPLSLDGSSSVTKEGRNPGSAIEAPRSNDTIIAHPVGSNDSFAGVALRYGVSIAALRRANQLWPSDPIHLRTELLIPRGVVPHTRRKPSHGPRTNAPVRSNAEPPPDMSLDLIAAARDIFLSALPARISLDSLSSRASVSEDHELDDLEAGRRRKMLSTVEAPFAQDGHELDLLAYPRTRLPDVALSCSPTDDRRTDPRHVPPIRGLRSSSHTALPERLPRRRPFALLPVRTLQLEPEPAMELPVRRSCIQPFSHTSRR